MDSKNISHEFASYLQSMVKLETFEKITRDLEEELADSQRVMKEIKATYDSIPKTENSYIPVTNSIQLEDLSKLLETDMPQFLLPDMAKNTVDVNLDEVISTMKCCAEDLKKNFVNAQPQPQNQRSVMESLDVDLYASTLNQLCKRLSNIQLNKTEINDRNIEFETKLTQLCENVNMFIQLVQVKTTISQSKETWLETCQNNNGLNYNSIISKLLTTINDVIYLLQNIN